jgi:hypothetical protein
MANRQQPRDHRITLDEAIRLTTAHQRGRRPEDPRSFHFDRAAYDTILGQPGCVGVRTYLGRHEGGSPTYVLVGIDADGKDMIDGAVMQDPDFCPPECPTESVLNANA